MKREEVKKMASDIRELAATVPETPEKDTRGAAFAAYNEAFALQRAAGRQEQKERARNNPPPRKILRALGSMQKPGRRGRKARARIQREIIRKVGDVRL